MPLVKIGVISPPARKATRESGISQQAAKDLLLVVEDLLDSAEYWSEYDVPIGIVDRMKAAVSKAKTMPKIKS